MPQSSFGGGGYNAMRKDPLTGFLRDFFIHALCVAGRSGTMFIITGENHAAQFVLRNGEIVYLTRPARLQGVPRVRALMSFVGAQVE